MKLSWVCVVLSLIGYSLAQSDPFFGCLEGCRDGSREGLTDLPNVAVCQGTFTGYVAGASAQLLCAETWHVCSQSRDRELLKQITYDAAIDIPGCYSLDAAHDFDTCRPCTGNVHEDDMAGVGGNCPSNLDNLRGRGSCFTGGRVDICCSGYLLSTGCQYLANITTGVVCCANNAENPCNVGECPNDCCGHGKCDIANGVCTCDTGYSGPDCCTHCADLNCTACLDNPTCGWCNSSDVCTQRDFPECFDLTLDKADCPADPGQEGSVNQTPVIVGSVVGAVGALFLGAGLAGLFLYRRFSAPEYAEFWDKWKMDGIQTNPLYAGSMVGGTSPLYEEKS